MEITPTISPVAHVPPGIGLEPIPQNEVGKATWVTEQFESILVKTFLKDAFKPMIEGAVNQKGLAHDIQRQWMTDLISEKIGKSGALGLSHVFQARFQDAPAQPSQPSK